MEVSVHLDVPVSLFPEKQRALLFEHEDGKTPDLFWVLRKIGKILMIMMMMMIIIIIIIIITVHPRRGHEGPERE